MHVFLQAVFLNGRELSGRSDQRSDTPFQNLCHLHNRDRALRGHCCAGDRKNEIEKVYPEVLVQCSFVLGHSGYCGPWQEPDPFVQNRSSEIGVPGYLKEYHGHARFVAFYRLEDFPHARR